MPPLDVVQQEVKEGGTYDAVFVRVQVTGGGVTLQKSERGATIVCSFGQILQTKNMR